MWEGQEKPIKQIFELTKKKQLINLRPPLKEKKEVELEIEVDTLEKKVQKLLWIKVNVEYTGYYQVYYEDEWILNSLALEMRHEGREESNLPVSDRLGLQSELFSLYDISEG
ncbi:MAG: hypothetical protein EZS28_015847 [Streblomastix strix]|uniref:Uncharacterized protein n=1 Tax=Streblomastix strix TaxID=222440 RepID=A0A5J4W170_9EUKA|nr:MAG: hypothetical protein EZS28_015847 [Streblomastix strix]